MQTEQLPHTTAIAQWYSTSETKLHTHTHTHSDTHARTHARTHTHTHTYLHRTHKHTHWVARTHARTHAHTHTHTRTYSAGKCTKAATNMHSKQAPSPVQEICRFLWIPKAKKLFLRASSSEVRARHLCRRFQSQIVRTTAFPRYRHFPNLSVCDSRRSPTSASLLSLFRDSDVKAFETAAIEDDAGTKTASDDALSDRILRKWLARRWSCHLCHV